MESRSLVQKYRIPIMIVSVLAIAFAIARPFIFKGGAGPKPPPPPRKHTQQYFYDLGSGALFAVGLNEVPPVAAPSQASATDPAPKGVRAQVYACGSCDNEADRKIAYLETYTPQAKELKLKTEAEADKMPAGRYQEYMKEWDAGRKVGLPAEKIEWLEATSEAGMAMIEGAQSLCGEKPVQVCYP